MQELFKRFPVSIELPVVWGEMDAFSHVNNAVYFRYFESARMDYGEKAGLWDYMEKTGIGPILKETNCRFKIPLTSPDKIFSLARISEEGEDFIVMEHVVFSQRHQKIAAEGKAVLVSFDYHKNQKTKLPEFWIREIARLEKNQKADPT